MNIQDFITIASDHKIVPVFYHSDSKKVIDTIEASYRGGIRIFEFVNRGENALETFKLIIENKSKYPDMTIGIGTIYDQEVAQHFIDAGASFVVSPCFIAAVATVCNDNEIPYLPGIATIKEAFAAQEVGCVIVKIFPASVIGSAFALAMTSVLPKLRFMPTGGISPIITDLKEWIDAGALCIGMGSQLFDKELISEDRFENLTNDINTVVVMAKQLSNI